MKRIAILLAMICITITPAYSGHAIGQLKITIHEDQSITISDMTGATKQEAQAMTLQAPVLYYSNTAPARHALTQAAEPLQTCHALHAVHDRLNESAGTSSLYSPDLYFYTGSGSTNQYTYNSTSHVLTLENSIANGGDATAGTFRLGWYLSGDLYFGSDLLVATAATSANLAAGYYVDLQATCDLDDFSTLNSGTYYILIYIDDLFQVNESNENNNGTYFNNPVTFTKAGQPDLYVYTGSGSDNSLTYDAVSHVLSVTNSIANNGSANAAGFRVGWYLSQYAALGIQDYFVASATASGSLEPGYFQDFTAQADLDDVAGLPAGNYYLWVYADDLLELPETDETNNANYFTTPQIAYSGYGLPNLGLYQGTGSVNGYRYDDYSQTLDVVASVGNFGDGESAAFQTGWYLSTDLILTQLDVLAATATAPGVLWPGYFYSMEASADLQNLPGLGPGEYYLIVYADPDDTITESDEEDNGAYFEDKIPFQQTSTDPDIQVQNGVLNLTRPDPGYYKTRANRTKLQRLEMQLSGDFRPGELAIRFKNHIPIAQANQFCSDHGLAIIKAWRIVPGAFLVRIVDGQATADKARALAVLPQLAWVEPDLKMSIQTTTPNDPGFSGLFGMHNAGQTGGVFDADIDAPEAWDLTTGSSNVIVGILDSGVDDDHPDLAANMWTNPGEIAGNGVDDDGNGYVDDIHGWDFAYDDNDPSDYCGHGTHVAGTVGAVGNNGTGVTGVCWQVKMMTLKYLDDDGSGYSSDAVTALEYAADNGAHLIQNSTGGGSYLALFEEAIRNANMLFVSAAGNDSKDTDLEISYPGGYNCDNILVVASLDHNNYLSTFSNFGAANVDVAAYGTDILSTKPDNFTSIDFGYPGQGLSSDEYGIISGTSMSTPQVSGAAALLLAYHPGYSWMDLKSAIMNSVDILPSITGRCVTHGKLNVAQALLQGGGSGGSPVFIIQNVGIARLTVSQLESSASWLSTTDHPAPPFDVNGGFVQQVTAAVDWNRAGSSPQTGTITVHSNDPDEPQTVITVHINGATPVEPEEVVVSEFQLSANYPNPFNPETSFQFDLPIRTHVKMTVYNARGERVAILLDEERPAGRHRIRFNGKGRESGLYFYQIKAGSWMKSGKMILLK